MNTRTLSLLSFSAAIAMSMTACNPSSKSGGDGSDTTMAEDHMMTESAAKTAVATISPLGENGISGTVTFTDENGQVQMVANITSPGTGTHAINIPETGACSAADGSLAGGHSLGRASWRERVWSY